MRSRNCLRTSLLIVSLAGLGLAHADTLLWHDDFEQYAVGSFPSDGGWFIRPGAPGVGSGAQHISTDRSSSGTQSFRLEGAQGLGVNIEKAIVLPGSRFAFEAMANTTRVDSRSVFMGFGTQDEVMAAVEFRHYGVIAARSGYGFTNLPVTFSANTWYKLKVVVDTAAASFDVYVNDVLAGQNLPIYPLPEPIDKVYLAVDNNGFGPDGTGFAPGGTISYFDDAKFLDLSVNNDDDTDGIPNAADQCPGTPSGQITDPANGCSIAQLVPCTGPVAGTTPWKTHGHYVSTISHVSQDFVRKGLLTAEQRDSLISAAAESACPAS